MSDTERRNTDGSSSSQYLRELDEKFAARAAALPEQHASLAPEDVAEEQLVADEFDGLENDLVDIGRLGSDTQADGMQERVWPNAGNGDAAGERAPSPDKQR